MIVAIINLKGGTGKTTSAIYLATAMHVKGCKVALIDADKQQSAMNWSADGNLPFKVQEASDNLREQCKNLKEQGYLIIVDCQDDPAVAYKVALLADKIVVPVAPTEQDVNRLEATINLIADVEETLNRDYSCILLVRWDKRRRLAQDFIEAYANEGYPVLKSKIRNLAVYQQGFGECPQYLDEYELVAKELLGDKPCQ